ncbi:NTP transferase domain-containing protein [Candidatus Methanocrinis natronophilus]|uniref:NTP transferase domain-containing protein n=1 Tax=Candidatus Methanocrinis natronophilus TaxID=3033396 RepID=A0ABT5X9L6_9EURY|nr:NTP transferase domain-containing protein [Candidatus Methanocrinis natronophilus]MDF0591343.1 NTP transferase domain-containing protein [Candidatus Methanocrinis natronophilus]
MAGGLGTRLQMGEKPMVEVSGRPLIDWVVSALEEAVERIYVATTARVPETAEWADDKGLHVLETPADGYVPDMIYSVEEAGIVGPVLIVMADLPLLRGDIIEEILEVYERVPEPALSVHVPLETYRRIGGRPDSLFNYRGRLIVPSGVNVLLGSQIRHEQEDYHLILDRLELAVNVNSPEDLAICESILRGGGISVI